MELYDSIYEENGKLDQPHDRLIDDILQSFFNFLQTDFLCLSPFFSYFTS